MSKRAEGKYDSEGEEFENDMNNTIPEWANVSFDELEVGERIGGGGVGIVYQGYWKGKAVALKTLFDARISTELKQEYMDELLVMSRVSHSNIVRFLGACMTPPNLCFIMELCDCSLFHMLHVERLRLSMEESYQASIDIASAVEYLHSLSPAIIHRDLKSHNVLRSSNGSYKLCDFGLVRNRNSAAGTPAYMAPELLEGRNFTKSVDCYALGVVIWEIFCQDIPFSRLDVPEIRQRVLNGKRPPIPSYGFNHRLARLITRCWDQCADDRPLIGEIVDELMVLEREAPSATYTEDLKDDILEGMIGRK
jgi:serine/threonine protein kinase